MVWVKRLAVEKLMCVCGFKIICSLGNLLFQNVYLCRLLHSTKLTDLFEIVALSVILSSCWFNISKIFQNSSLECRQIIIISSKYLIYVTGDLLDLLKAASSHSATYMDETFGLKRVPIAQPHTCWYISPLNSKSFPFRLNSKKSIMFLSGLSESGYLSNALLTELMPASIPVLVYMESISSVTKNESLGIFSFDNFDKRSSVFFTKRSCLFAIGFKWESIYCDISYDSDPQPEIIGRPGGVLLSGYVLTGLWIFESRKNVLVCDLYLATWRIATIKCK